MNRVCDICGRVFIGDILVGDERGQEKFNEALINHYETTHAELLYVIQSLSESAKREVE